MPRLSINEMTTFRWSFEEDLREYRAAGISAMGVWRRKLSDFGEARGIELLQTSGLAVSNLLWAGGFTGSEGHSYRESIDDATDAVRTAAALRCKSLIVYSGARAGHTHNHARRLLVTALKELAMVAAEQGVVLALEPMHPACAGDCTFLTSLSDAQAVVQQVASENVRLSVDTYYVHDAENVLEQLRQLAKQIAIVHLADGHPPGEEQHRTPLGRGRVPLTELVAALREGGYDGDFDVVLFGDEIAPADYVSLLRDTKSAYEQLIAGKTVAC
jgi:sugar phosphate isomerase/epimerase